MSANAKNLSVAIASYMREVGEAARAAAGVLATADTRTKNQALEATAEALGDARSDILAQNSRDLEAAEGRGLSPALVDRLADLVED